MKELLALLEAAGWLAGAIWLGAAVLACARRVGALQRAAGFLPASLLGGAALLAAGPAGADILPISPDAWALVRSLPAVLIIPIIAAAPLGLNARAMGRPALSFTAILLGVSALQLAIGALFAAAFGAQIYATFGLELAAGFVGGHSTAGLISRALADLGAPWWADAQSVAAGTATVGLGGGILLGLGFIYLAQKRGWLASACSRGRFLGNFAQTRLDDLRGLSTAGLRSQPQKSPHDSVAAATSEDADASYINRNARARDGEAGLMDGKFAAGGSADKFTDSAATADKSAAAVASTAKSVTVTDVAVDKSVAADKSIAAANSSGRRQFSGASGELGGQLSESNCPAVADKSAAKSAAADKSAAKSAATDVAVDKSVAAANSSGRLQFSGASGELGGQLSESNCPAVTDKCTAKPTDSAAAASAAADAFTGAQLGRALCTLLVLSALALAAHAAAAPFFAGFGTWTYALFIALGFSLAAPRAAAAAAPAAPRRAIAAILSDFAIAAAIASMDLRLLSEHFAAFCALCALGFVATALFLAAMFAICLPSRWFLRFIAAWGSSTGVFLTGILLLRAADPAGKSGVLSEYSIAFSLSGLVFYAVLQPVFALAAGGQALKAAAFMAALCAASALLAVLLRHKR